MDNLILIPARSGSTRVKNKNIRRLGDRPLIGHVIQSALDSRAGRVIVSTNCADIARTARKLGAETPFMRPPELATAEAASIWVILDALRRLKRDQGWTPAMVAYCPPTNPFTTGHTIKEMFTQLAAGPAEINSIVTITTPQTHPFRIVARQSDGRLQVGPIEVQGQTILDIERSQDWPPVWEGSPACRMTRASFFLDQLANVTDVRTIAGKTYDADHCTGYEIPPREAFDIDDEDDWALAQYLLAQNPKRHAA